MGSGQGVDSDHQSGQWSGGNGSGRWFGCGHCWLGVWDDSTNLSVLILGLFVEYLQVHCVHAYMHAH